MTEDEKETRKLINLLVSHDLHAEGKALAKKRGLNLSSLLRMLLIQEIEKDKASR